MLCDSCGHVNDEKSDHCTLCHYSWVEHKHIQIEGESKQINGYAVKDKEGKEEDSYLLKKIKKEQKMSKCRKRLLYTTLVTILISIGIFLIWIGIGRDNQLHTLDREGTYCIVKEVYDDECVYDTDSDTEVCYTDFKYHVNMAKTENNGTDYKCKSYDGQSIYCEDDQCSQCDEEAGAKVGDEIICWIDCSDFGCRLHDPMSYYWQAALALITGIILIVVPLCVIVCCIIYVPLQRLMTK